MTDWAAVDRFCCATVGLSAAALRRSPSSLGGYLTVWGGFSALAALAQWLLCADSAT